MFVDEKFNSSKKSPRFNLCCSDGNVDLPSIKDPPTALKDLYRDTSARGTVSI